MLQRSVLSKNQETNYLLLKTEKERKKKKKIDTKKCLKDMVLSTNIKIIFPSPTKMYLASWSSGADSDVPIIVKLDTLRQSVIPVPISKVFLQFSLLYCSFLWPAAKGAVEKFSSAWRSTVGIAATTKFLWKGRTGRDNRNMFYICLQIKNRYQVRISKDKVDINWEEKVTHGHVSTIFGDENLFFEHEL